VKIYGLDLFSGIGGITKALSQWVVPVTYCERDRWAAGVLLSCMQSRELPAAPIWADVSTLRGSMLPQVDIIYGGFPCQDISVAGTGKGLGGQRSGLFFEIVRLAEEIKPTFIFLENVPAIRTRGLDIVIQELTKGGYDCRWTMLSAEEIGANHKRERWFLLAHATRQLPHGSRFTWQGGGQFADSGSQLPNTGTSGRDK
jgi:DNA (cytosine-5)-methyltransferase 1